MVNYNDQIKKVRFCTAFYHECELAEKTFQGLKDSDKYTFHKRFISGSCIVSLRNCFATDFTDEILDYDYFLIFDADQYCEPEVIYKLLKHDQMASCC